VETLHLRVPVIGIVIKYRMGYAAFGRALEKSTAFRYSVF